MIGSWSRHCTCARSPDIIPAACSFLPQHRCSGVLALDRNKHRMISPFTFQLLLHSLTFGHSQHQNHSKFFAISTTFPPAFSSLEPMVIIAYCPTALQLSQFWAFQNLRVFWSELSSGRWNQVESPHAHIHCCPTIKILGYRWAPGFRLLTDNAAHESSQR